MNTRRLIIAATAAAGLALGAAATASAYAAPYAFSTDGGSKNVMVKRTASTNSVFFNGEDFHGNPISQCIRLPFNYSGWNSLNMPVPDGSNLNLITFSSSNCSSGYQISHTYNIPNHTSMINFWADMTH
jgi:hypothetical protein